MLAIIDLETTGLHQDCGLVQIGCLLCSDDLTTIHASGSYHCHPHPAAWPWEAEALRVSGYDARTWDRKWRATSERDALIALCRFLAGRCPRPTPVAFGVAFDAQRLAMAMERSRLGPNLALNLSHRWECARSLFATWRRVARQPGTCSLEALAILAGHWQEGERPAQHDAFEDCRATLAGLRWLTDRFRAGLTEEGAA